MRIKLSERTSSFLNSEAKRLGLAPEEFVELILERYVTQQNSEEGMSELRLLSYEELLEKSKNGTRDERVMANMLRTSFIR